ncbi:MAG: transglycosylase SLT domain-containing protein [Halieaceae bacterium]|nr:transglycosylase SLT domain-containing protein [Halieaceae bacterium]
MLVKSLWRSLLVLLGVSLLLSGCTASQPKKTDNICEIFREKGSWYDKADDASKRWHSPIPVMMAIMYQESHFKAKARPPRSKLLGFIPWTRPSDAYGYAQAKDATWDIYQRDSGNNWSSRKDFGDAIDFIGWYNDTSHRRCNIRRDDPYHLYLAYHEGHGGFNRRTFKNKQWLKGVAKKVSARSRRYSSQLKSCEKEFQSKGWFFGVF